MSAKPNKPRRDVLDNYRDAFSCVCHPAFRLGFLDALGGRPLDHDSISCRIACETPESFFSRNPFYGAPFSATDIEVAQRRYEEGRLLQVQERLLCRSWSHPDFPPVQVREWLRRTYPEKPKNCGLDKETSNAEANSDAAGQAVAV
ncbi:hypothetical protein J7444_08050 [Labrenzia sp. R4_1]|uniref:hypothetical protein n=1 Tax=Labrenzia sp. R4_1 TaxID=2821106 RepID=UPI001ADB946F|nr:hypothetical protein [Labrenzia sp. R4_1]MBO9424669.1 hypothetical protein [Labrenzia sp. R4_1]